MNQIGIYNLPRGIGDAGNKALEVFTKLKRRAEQIEAMPRSESGQVTPLGDIEPNVQELSESAMNSYRLQDEVVKTESGFEAV